MFQLPDQIHRVTVGPGAAVAGFQRRGQVAAHGQHILDPGFLQLRDAGMDVDFRGVPYSVDAGYKMLMQLAEEKKLPDGVVLFSDTLAPSFIRAAYELKIRIPEDMNIVSMDNLYCGRFTIPSLTTMDFCRYEQGRIALRNLIAALNSNTFPEGAVFKSSLIRRESL